MKLKLGIDMDGTVVDFMDLSFKRVKELYGVSLKKEEASIPKTAELVWSKLNPEQQLKYKDPIELYSEICNPGFFLKLEAFPGAIDAVKNFYKAGYEIIWITKILTWEQSAGEKAIWLKEHFGDIEYSTIMVDSVHSKKYIDVDIIIDDDPYVLADIKGSVPIMINQPWNRHVADKYVSFDSIADPKLFELINNHDLSLQYWKNTYEE